MFLCTPDHILSPISTVERSGTLYPHGAGWSDTDLIGGGQFINRDDGSTFAIPIGDGFNFLCERYDRLYVRNQVLFCIN